MFGNFTRVRAVVFCGGRFGQQTECGESKVDDWRAPCVGLSCVNAVIMWE